MANIELPKDAEGREIPLDTTVMFGGNGNTYYIVRWSYITELNAGDENAKSWYAVTKGRTVLDPELMYLNPLDSWEKLEEDLGRAVENGNAGDESVFQSMACAYMNRDGEMCGDCKFWNKYVRNCTNQMLEDVVSRIRKLRGDGK